MTDTWPRQPLPHQPGYNSMRATLTPTYNAGTDTLTITSNLGGLSSVELLVLAAALGNVELEAGSFTVVNDKTITIATAEAVLGQGNLTQIDVYNDGLVYVGTWTGTLAIDDGVGGGASGSASVMPAAELAGGVSAWWAGLAVDRATGVVGLAIPLADQDEYMAAKLDANGVLVPAFGGDGRANFDLGFPTEISSVADFDAAGNLFVAGQSDHGGYLDVNIIMVEADGTLDPAFGTSGRTYTNNGDNLYPEGLLVVPAGHPDSANTKFVVLVRDTNTQAYSLLEFASDGTLNAQTPLVGSFNRAVLRWGTANQLFVIGRSGFPGSIAVEKFDTTFAADTGFGGDGRIEENLGLTGGYDNMRAQIDAAGKILVSTASFIVDHDQWIVARLDATGAPDAAFGGGDGWVEVDVPGLGASDSTYGQGIDVQSDGKIIAAAIDSSGAVTAEGRAVITRLDATTGAPDNTFGTAGFASFSVAGISFNDDVELVVLDDDSIIVKAWVGGDDQVHVAKFDADGVLDTSYGD